MAYLRGDQYVWDDDERLHIWVADGYDGWDESGWGLDEDGRRRSDAMNASGVSISMEIMDEYVVIMQEQKLPSLFSRMALKLGSLWESGR